MAEEHHRKPQLVKVQRTDHGAQPQLIDLKHSLYTQRIGNITKEDVETLEEPEAWDRIWVYVCFEIVSFTLVREAAPRKISTILLPKQDLKNNTTHDVPTWIGEFSQASPLEREL